MWTQWNTAQTVAQLEQDQIAYTNPSNLENSARDLVSTAPLLGLHLGVRSLLIQDSNMLLFSNFNFHRTNRYDLHDSHYRQFGLQSKPAGCFDYAEPTIGFEYKFN
jgi:hypothetical protein